MAELGVELVRQRDDDTSRHEELGVDGETEEHEEEEDGPEGGHGQLGHGLRIHDVRQRKLWGSEEQGDINRIKHHYGFL